jgi:hypothetical protein
VTFSRSMKISIWRVHNFHLIRAITFFFHVLYLMAFALSITFITYAFPADVRYCRAELIWEQLFRSKNEATIRSLQNQMRCCGFNSMRDRAWPFPARNVDARTCERTLGFSTNCGLLWDKRIYQVILVCIFASFLNMLIMASASKSLQVMIN